MATAPDVRRSLARLVTGTATAALTAATAHAQVEPAAPATDPGGLEEIVVTAQKRAERLQDTPIAITAFTAEAIERRGVTDIAQLALAAPNVRFDFTSPISGASNAASIFIRGIGQTDFALTTEAGVGTYIDGVYVSRSLGGVLDVLDIERTEILRGPQGTLFGRNTIGGAVSITSKSPDREFGGRFQTSVGDFGRIYLRGSVSLPFGPDTGVRISASSKTRDGFVYTALSPQQQTALGQRALTDLGNENRQAVRLVLDHRFAPSFGATVIADYGRVRENNAADRLQGITGTLADGPLVFVHNTFTAPGLTLPGFANGLYSLDNFGPRGRDVTFSTGPNGTRLDSWGVSLTLDYDIADTLALKSISAYRKTSGRFARDADGSPLTITHTSNYAYRHEQVSQELQAVGSGFGDRLKYAAGVYFFHETGSDPLIVELPPALGTIFQDVAAIRNDSYAAFAQLTFRITSGLSLTAGGRYTVDEKQFRSDQYLRTGPVAPLVLGAPPGIDIPLVPRNSLAKERFEQFTPKVTLDWKLDDLLLYATYAKGFKSGGFNLRYVAPRAAILAFDPETAETYEAGVKFEGLDQRLRVNLAGFFTDYSNIQVTVFENLGAPVTLNAGDAELKGFEAEVTALPLAGVELTANVGYLDARYKRVRANPALVSTPEQIISTDTRLPKAPEWQGSVSGAYSFALLRGTADLRGDLFFSSSLANDAQNSRFLNQGAFQILNLSAGYTAPDDRWTARVFVQNVTDTRYIVSGDSNFGIGFHEANFNRPREFGVKIGVQF